MKVECLNCKTVYNIDPQRIPPQGAWSVCKRCNIKIHIPPSASENMDANATIEIDSPKYYVKAGDAKAGGLKKHNKVADKKFNPANLIDTAAIRAVGMAQRKLLWAFLMNIAGWIVPFILPLAIPFQLYCVYILARALKKDTVTAILCMLSIFLPGIGMVVLLVLNNQASKTMKKAGIKVGLMGAKKSDLPG